MPSESQQIKNHFQKVDPIIFALYEKMPARLLVPNTAAKTYFGKLCQDIVSQQLGMKAADAIIKRFLALFPNGEPTPKLVLAQPEATFREIGTSWAKARYLHALAEAVETKVIDFSAFPNMDNEMVIQELIKVKGIGRWTAEMFLIFTLGRPDVFSLGDLGLKNAIIKNYGKKVLENKHELEKYLAKWSPFRSYASLALWHSLNNR